MDTLRDLNPEAIVNGQLVLLDSSGDDSLEGSEGAAEEEGPLGAEEIIRRAETTQAEATQANPVEEQDAETDESLYGEAAQVEMGLPDPEAQIRSVIDKPVDPFAEFGTNSMRVGEIFSKRGLDATQEDVPEILSMLRERGVPDEEGIRAFADELQVIKRRAEKDSDLEQKIEATNAEIEKLRQFAPGSPYEALNQKIEMLLAEKQQREQADQYMAMEAARTEGMIASQAGGFRALEDAARGFGHKPPTEQQKHAMAAWACENGLLGGDPYTVAKLAWREILGSDPLKRSDPRRAEIVIPKRPTIPTAGTAQEPDDIHSIIAKGRVPNWYTSD